MVIAGPLFALLGVILQISTLHKIGFGLGPGLVLVYVEPGSPADVAGLQVGDWLVALGGLGVYLVHHSVGKGSANRYVITAKAGP